MDNLGLNKYKAIFGEIAKDWLPPAVLRLLRKLHRGGGITFLGPFATWDEAVRMSSGYDSQEILDKVLAATLKVKNGEAAYERDSVIFNEVQNAWPVAAGLMWAAAQDGGRLSVLDFGGSLGSSYFQNRQFLEGLQNVRWSIVEQTHFVKAGKLYIQDERLRFYETIDECEKTEKPNVVLLSSVLQYLENPEVILRELIRLDPRIIIVDLTIVNSGSTDIIYTQKTPPNIYSAIYPVWSLSVEKLGEPLARANYQLVSEFKTLEFPSLTYINSEFKGFLYSRKSG